MGRPFGGLELLGGALDAQGSFGALHDRVEWHVSVLFNFIQGCHIHLQYYGNSLTQSDQHREIDTHHIMSN